VKAAALMITMLAGVDEIRGVGVVGGNIRGGSEVGLEVGES